MSDKYILDASGNPLRCDDLLTWAHWFETANRRVDEDIVGDVRVSTVFLGLDHSFGPQAAPQLFETMVFGGPHDGHEDRYATRDEAVAGHREVLSMVREVVGKP